MMTNTHESTAIAETPLADEQARALEAVRIHFREDHAVFSLCELARVRFLHSTVRAERLVP